MLAVIKAAPVPALEQDAAIKETPVQHVIANASDDLDTIQEEVDMLAEFPSVELPDEEQYENLEDDKNQAAHELLDAVNADDQIVDNNSSPKTKIMSDLEKIKLWLTTATSLHRGGQLEP